MKNHTKKLIKVATFKAYELLHDKGVLDYVKSDVGINHNYDVPYIAGYSKDGKTIYIDRHFYPTCMKEQLLKYLLIHEKTEKALIDLHNLDYQEAHHLATEAERLAVDNDGMTWREYDKHYSKWEKGLDNERLTRCPPDLDLTPYKDDRDFKKFKIMRKFED